LLSIHKGKVQILISSFENGMAAVLGANSLIIKELKVDSNNKIEK